MDISAMRANFAKAAATGDEAPLYFYSHLFLSHPETRQMFPVSMAHQRDRLFSALGDVVARVDDLDALVPILQQLGRDHRKFGTLAAHYPAVGGSLLATLEHFDDEWTPELAKDWTEAYTLVAEVMIAAADEAAEEPAWWDADVVGHDRRTIDVAVLQVRPRARYDYRAGQSISLETDLRPRLWRYYSPANAPRPDGLMELHVKARDGGPVSSALVRRVGVGDVLRLGPPLGHLALDGDLRPRPAAGRRRPGAGAAEGLDRPGGPLRPGPARGPVRRLPHGGPDLRSGRPAQADAGESLADGHLRGLGGQDLLPRARGRR